MRKKSMVALALVATVVATTGCAGKKESSSATTSSAVTTTAEETTKKQEVSTAETAASDTVQSPSSDATQNGESKGKEATSQQETTKQQAANDANTADAEPVQEEAAVNEDVEVLADIPDEVPLAAFTKTAETGYVMANRVNIRQQPSLSGKKMSSVLNHSRHNHSRRHHKMHRIRKIQQKSMHRETLVLICLGSMRISQPFTQEVQSSIKHQPIERALPLR